MRAHGDAFRLNAELTTEALTRFIREEVTKVGFRCGILGLSGGIDSAVVAFLTTRALGAEHTVCVAMPYGDHDPASLTDAQMVADLLGVRLLCVDISPMVDAYFADMPEADRIRRGNVMARLRMIVLYDLSRVHQALVIGTSNKTELLIGYSTLWGDMAAAMWPLGDIYKTEVRQLAEYLGVPQPLIAKPPSAGLWDGQTDEGEIGMSYAELDAILVELVDKRIPKHLLPARGFDAKQVERVSEMMRTSQFKRRLPLMPKISTRSINHDFRYKRDWGW
ncbi:MAG: NAD+ synthase [Acidobacteriota bacterium]|nr:NAD+ synthase [Blastocatellia bacterium]MDW8238115.1 NAD+ synthase [Acidobacteriota bacterium]